MQLLKEIQIESGTDGDEEEMLVSTTTTTTQQITTTTHHQQHHHHHQHNPADISVHHHHHHHHHTQSSEEHLQHQHQQQQQIGQSNVIVKQSSPTNTSAALDDCSDISGYHSDSEGSPTALRSPRSGGKTATSGKSFFNYYCLQTSFFLRDSVFQKFLFLFAKRTIDEQSSY